MRTDENLTAVIFDMDGTLIDSEPIFKKIAKRSASELGYNIEDDVYNGWVGLPRESLEKAIIESLGKNFPMTRFKEIFAENWISYTELNGISPKSGIPDLLESLVDLEIAMAVATSTPTRQAQRSLEIAKIKTFFKFVVGGDQVKCGKPAPDIFLKAASILNTSPKQCVAIEDSAIGIKSANAAGMLTILIPDTIFPGPEIVALADYVLHSSEAAGNVIQLAFNGALHEV